MDALRSLPHASAPREGVCAGCGLALDALRAGHVAILDGKFRYFCKSACKQLFAAASSRADVFEAPTMAPPPVQSGSEPPPVSGERGRTEKLASHPEETLEHVAAPASVLPPVEEVEIVSDQGPHTLRSPASSNDVASAVPASFPPPSVAPRSVAPPSVAPPSVVPSSSGASSRVPATRGNIASLIPAVGIGASVLATVIPLAGRAASTLQMPLALLAAILVVVRAATEPRQEGGPSPLVLVGPVVVSAIVAAVARVTGDAHAETHAAFTGLASGAVLLFDVLHTRARRDIVEARRRFTSALEVPVRVVRGDSVADIDAGAVKAGEYTMVETGETVGVDGTVVAGSAEVAPWVDAPIVVEKNEGAAVVAGASVVSGRLRVHATFAGQERAWIRKHAPRERVETKAPLAVLSSRLIERVSPAAAVLVAVAAYANNGGWLDVAMAACAGAFALSSASAASAAALSHVRAQIAAQRHGIIYKDAVALDGAARADVAVVCSRGTVLLGEPEIVAIEAAFDGANGASGRPSQRADVARVLALAAGAEVASSDTFAAAALRAARTRNVAPEAVRSAIVHSGLGVTALASSGEKVIVGSRSFLLMERVSVAIADARITELEAEGRSVLCVALGGRLIGILALQDGIRPGVRAAVHRLHDAHIEPVLLSGEARDTCETIARSLEIEHVRPEILPDDRGREVRALSEGGRIVATIGHPSSDDGALGAADVSIAMGAAGAAPGEWSVALASDDVRDASLALTIPRAFRDRAKHALLVGVGAHALGLLGIAFGAAPAAVAPILGVGAVVLSLGLVREPPSSGLR